jgi:hypothetical protein
MIVTKLDAAKRQLRTAIRLWFNEGDPVSIHALASAAHEVIHTLFRRKGLHGLMFDTDVIKPEYRKDWAKRLKVAATFFKHAQKDPDGQIEFAPGLNELILIVGASGLGRMGEPQELEETALGFWTAVHRPEFLAGNVVANNIPIYVRENFARVDKKQLFQIVELFWGNTDLLGTLAEHFRRTGQGV